MELVWSSLQHPKSAGVLFCWKRKLADSQHNTKTDLTKLFKTQKLSQLGSKRLQKVYGTRMESYGVCMERISNPSRSLIVQLQKIKKFELVKYRPHLLGKRFCRFPRPLCGPAKVVLQRFRVEKSQKSVFSPVITT